MMRLNNACEAGRVSVCVSGIVSMPHTHTAKPWRDIVYVTMMLKIKLRSYRSVDSVCYLVVETHMWLLLFNWLFSGNLRSERTEDLRFDFRLDPTLVLIHC